MPIRWVSRFFSRGPRRLTPPLRDQIRRSFDQASQDEEHFPSTIDPRIYHVRLIQEFFGDLAGKRILDAGCGKGRFARILHETDSSARICGLDISPKMLKFVPRGVSSVAGSMTSLPFASESFDCVYATESLEHAVEIETAVSELCRVLRPGGHLVIIDKNVEQFGKLKTPAWEKWFDRKEVEALLERDCREVSSRFISYWEDVEPDGMFLAWLARK
jgi:ubiquinone/menaquinone biosynthesis C-methylase UbiE